MPITENKHKVTKYLLAALAIGNKTTERKVKIAITSALNFTFVDVINRLSYNETRDWSEYLYNPQYASKDALCLLTKALNALRLEAIKQERS